jgi:hypothetical protein
MDGTLKEQLDQHIAGLQTWKPEAILFPCDDNGSMIDLLPFVGHLSAKKKDDVFWFPCSYQDGTNQESRKQLQLQLRLACAEAGFEVNFDYNNARGALNVRCFRHKPYKSTKRNDVQERKQ